MSAADSTARVVLIEPYVGGHRAGYLEHLVRGWAEGSWAGKLVAAVPPGFVASLPSLQALVEQLDPERTEVVEMSEVPVVVGKSAEGRALALLQVGMQNARLLRSCVERWRPEHVVHMQFEHLQVALAAGLRLRSATAMSGVAFRISHHHPLPTSAPWAARLRQIRKNTLLRAALRNRHVHAVLSSDPTVPPLIDALSARVRGVFMPDPVIPPGEVDAGHARAAYGLPADKALITLFGAITERKGVFQLLEAVRHLTADEARRFALFLAGPVHPPIASRLQEAIARSQAEHGVSVTLVDRFMYEEEIHTVIGMSDLIAVPYQLHPGTSSVLIRAAAAGVPVLGQEYGLMGQQIAKHRLGRAVDTLRPGAISQGIRAFLREPGGGFDRTQAAAFASEHTADAYARTVLDVATSSAPRPALM